MSYLGGLLIAKLYMVNMYLYCLQLLSCHDDPMKAKVLDNIVGRRFMVGVV